MNPPAPPARPLPIVPSKNALRALRRLAFSRPVLVVGTIGSVCGIATLNHEVYRRIRLAEHALESKRAIRSLSNGRGAAHLNALFEAAERGEDFSFGARGSKRRKRMNSTQSRPLSVPALRETTEDTEDVPFGGGPENDSVESSIIPASAGEAIARWPSSLNIAELRSNVTENPIDSSRSRPKHPDYRHGHLQLRGRPDGGKNQRPPRHSDRPRRTTTSSHRDRFHHPNLRTQPEAAHAKSLPWHSHKPLEHTNKGALYDEGPTTDPRGFGRFMKQPEQMQHPSRHEQNGTNPDHSIKTNSGQRAAGPSKAHVPRKAAGFATTHEAPMPAAGVRAMFSPEGVPRGETSAGVPTPSLVMQPDTSQASEEVLDDTINDSISIPFLPMQPDTSQTPKEGFHDTTGDQISVPFLPMLPGAFHAPIQIGNRPLSIIGAKHVLLFNGKNAPGDTLLFAYLDDEHIDEVLRLSINTANPSPEASMPPIIPWESVPHTALFSGLCRFIQEDRANAPSHWKWLAVMKHFTSLNNSLGWPIAEAIFNEFRTFFSTTQVCVPPVFLLIQHLMATAPSSDRLQRVLFTASRDDTGNEEELLELSTRYLQFYCEGEQSASHRVLQLTQLLDVGKNRDVGPLTSLAGPILRALIHAKDFAVAETLLERLGAELGSSEYIAMLQEYTFYNACEGNWAVVESMLDGFHNMGRSRSSPIAYGRLFQRIVSQHIAKNTALEAFEFVVHAIQNAGVVPTMPVSRAILLACVRDGRWDLVDEWLKLVTSAFPRSIIGFGIVQSGWLLADGLFEYGASCEEITRLCQTIASGCRLDPFAKDFREYAVDLVKSDLRKRLHVALKYVEIGSHSSEDIDSMAMDELLSCVYEFRAASTPTGPNAVAVEDLKRDLAIQISAVVELAKVFRGDLNALFLNLKKHQVSPLKSRRNVLDTPRLDSPDALKQTFPEIHQHGRSPKIGTLATALAKHYRGRRNQDSPIDYAPLKCLIVGYGPQYPLEVLALVEAIHGELCSRRQYFDTALYQKWMYLASTCGSGESALRALQAVIQCSDQVEWTHHFRRLCLFVCSLGYVDKRGLWDQKWEMKGGRNKSQAAGWRAMNKRLLRVWRRWSASRKETFEFPQWRRWDLDVR